MGFSNRMTFVVPTKDRPQEIRRMLASVHAQPVHPHEIILVDGGDRTVADVPAEFPDLRIRYLRVYPPSLSRQRNAGMDAVDPAATLAGYVDDDLVFEPGSVEAMLRFWEDAGPDVGGAGFNIVNMRPRRVFLLEQLFLQASRRRGQFLRSGFETPLWVGPVEGAAWVRWLNGGATIWRRAITQEVPYDEWFEGTGYLEDVDFSYRVGERYRMALVGDARVQHLTTAIRRDRNYILGRWQAVNRMYFVRKHLDEFSLPLTYWALLGLPIFNTFLGVGTGDAAFLDRARGNCAGILRVLQGRLERSGGLLK
jgi:glycosyltransferase involved in cell wall biosynthesis